MNNQIPKKIAVINDIAGFGRCSMTVALPVISALGVQACPVPTSIFSNHTAFPTHYFFDHTKQMSDYLKGWANLNLSFDGIYSGFLGSIDQVEIVKSFVTSQNLISQNKNSVITIVDPVMGDHGKAYKTITPDFTDAMKDLITHSNVITPNITEACLLTNTIFKESGWTLLELDKIGERLHGLGPEKIIITGIHDGINITNYLSIKNAISTCYVSPIRGESRPGTGDIFASIIAACTINNIPIVDSVKKAADFVGKCTKASADLGIPIREGVCFENFLYELTN